MSEQTAHRDASLPEELLGWRLPMTPAEVPCLLELAERLRASRVDWRLVDTLTRFQPCGYTRRPLARTPACELLLACWMPGQASRVHDHGGSYGASLVLRGELEETQYCWADTHLEPWRVLSTRPGDVLLEQPETIHRVANRFARGAVTLHLYAPPMAGMTDYDADVRSVAPAAAAWTGTPRPRRR